ncbi:MAG: 30S ribosomal protein S18 [bacterium]|jgi:small subunit ribosomal protein S18|nr:30S ribosomal protein S18 [bacterium]HRF95892.1 30S ribosomal protein S18 [Aggregatilineales bacterium]
MAKDRDFDFEEEELDDDGDGGGRGRGRGRSGGGDGGDRKGRRRRNSYCPPGKCFDYKDSDGLRRYVSETGKIKPRRQTGNCARCQRELAREVKRARHLGLLAFVNSAD